MLILTEFFQRGLCDVPIVIGKNQKRGRGRKAF